MGGIFWELNCSWDTVSSRDHQHTEDADAELLSGGTAPVSEGDNTATSPLSTTAAPQCCFQHRMETLCEFTQPQNNGWEMPFPQS